MKKYLFAVQVFGLTAMFPITAFLELNHGARNSSESISFTNEMAKIGKPGTGLHNAINKNAVTETVGITFQAILLQAF